MWINVNLEYISKDDVVVLANNRQVLAFKKTWGLQKSNSALPQIFSWQQYLQQTWRTLQPNSSKRLISNIESRVLIGKSMTRLGQNINSRLLDEVVKNNDYCHAHLIPHTQLSESHIQNCKLFSDWINDYQQTKLKNNLLDINDLSKLILNRDSALNKPYIYGFKTLTAEQSLLFNNIGYQVLDAKQPNTDSNNKTFQTTIDEVLSAAQWAKDLNTQRPNAHIAIIVPNLAQDHHQIKSIFDQVFNDTLIETGQKSYNISLGLSLGEYPLIRHIVSILKLCEQLQNNHINTETFNAVITSPYIAHAQIERSSRALMVNHVLSLSKTHFKLTQIDQYLKTTPKLNALIKAIIDQKPSKQQTHDNWLLYFNTCLQNWGFATDRTLSSDEYQLFNKYQQTSLGLNQLAQSQKSVGALQAITDLTNWLSQVIFQPESAKTPIQILGSLEAEGLYFDDAWVLGMTDNFLPASLNSPRFIPSSVAQSHQIPHSNFELITKDAQDTLNNLINLSDRVIFSYAKTHLESEQRPSPLLQFDNKTIKLKHSHQETMMDYLSNAKAPPLTNTQLSGGVTILKDQMACAFKGFAHRLNIKKFDPPHIGLNRSEQGEIVHRILEKFYQSVNSRDTLLDYQPDVLNQIIDDIIQQTLKHYDKSGFAQVEHDRLSQLVHKFIDTEKQREAFQVIATEQTIKANVNGLTFNTRLDRIDKMDNGDQIIFDYKTGNIPSNPWCGETIKEPQLPIYASTNSADGIAFIKPAADKISYIGTAKNQESLPKKTTKQKSCTEWDEQLKLWQQQLNQTSLNYQQGEAAVLPAKNACTYCEFDSLCRVEK